MSVSKKQSAPRRTREHRLSGACWCHPTDQGIKGGLHTWKHSDKNGAFLMSEQRRELTMKEARVELGRRIEKLRIEKAWTRRNLAEQLGVKDNFIYLLERGSSGASVGILQLIAEAYDLTLDELLGEIRFPKQRA